MPLPQARMGAAAVGERVFVFGGSSPGHQRDLLIYDADADEWTFGTPLPTPNSHGTALALDGLVYLFGGRGEDGETTNAAHRYDPTTDAWEALPHIPAPMASPSAVVVDGRIWLTTPIVDPAAGGASRLAVYDPAAERWRLATIGDATRFSRAPAAALAVTGGRILLLGGGGSLTIQILPTAGVELVDP